MDEKIKWKWKITFLLFTVQVCVLLKYVVCCISPFCLCVLKDYIHICIYIILNARLSDSRRRKYKQKQQQITQRLPKRTRVRLFGNTITQRNIKLLIIIITNWIVAVPERQRTIFTFLSLQKDYTLHWYTTWLYCDHLKRKISQQSWAGESRDHGIRTRLRWIFYLVCC